MSLEIKDLDQVLTEIGSGVWQFKLLTTLCAGTFADAMELSLLAFLTPCAQAEFDLTDSEASMISSVVFLGSFIGSIFFGIYADIQGRKSAYIISLSIIALFGIATFFAPNYRVLLLFRGCLGFGIGGSIAPFDYIAEVVPVKKRGSICLVAMLFFGLGSILTTAIAWAVLGRYGWHILALVCTIPVFLCLFSSFTIPESPRWLLSQGRTAEATEALNRAAAVNNKELGQFILKKTSEKRISHRAIFKIICSKYLYNSIFFTLSWFCLGFAYFATVSEISLMFMRNQTTTQSCSFLYLNILVSALSESLFTVFSLVFIEKSRRLTQGVNYFLAAVLVIFLGANNNSLLLSLLAFATRGFVCASSNATWVITPESFPTEIRASMHSFLYLVSRIGAMTSSLVVYSELSRQTVCTIISLSCLIPGVCSLAMKETAGTQLDQSPEPKKKKINQVPNETQELIA